MLAWVQYVTILEWSTGRPTVGELAAILKGRYIPHHLNQRDKNNNKLEVKMKMLELKWKLVFSGWFVQCMDTRKCN